MGVRFERPCPRFAARSGRLWTHRQPWWTVSPRSRPGSNWFTSATVSSTNLVRQRSDKLKRPNGYFLRKGVGMLQACLIDLVILAERSADELVRFTEKLGIRSSAGWPSSLDQSPIDNSMSPRVKDCCYIDADEFVETQKPAGLRAHAKISDLRGSHPDAAARESKDFAPPGVCSLCS